MKRFLSFILFAVMTVTACPVLGERVTSNAAVTIDGVRTAFFSENGDYLPPLEENGIVYVPVLSLAESLQQNVTADADTLTVKVDGIRTAFFDESGNYLPPVNVDGVLYVPLIAWAESTGISVSMEGNTYALTRKSGGSDAPAAGTAFEFYGTVPLGMDNFSRYYALSQSYAAPSGTPDEYTVTYTLSVRPTTPYEPLNVVIRAERYGQIVISGSGENEASYQSTVRRTDYYPYDGFVEAIGTLIMAAAIQPAITSVSGSLRMSKAEADQINAADYRDAVQALDTVASLYVCENLVSVFSRLERIDYEDSARYAHEALEKLAVLREESYREALALEEAGDWAKALEKFETLGDYLDCASHAEACSDALAALAAEQEKENIYQKALRLEKQHREEEAVSLLSTIEGYKDSAERIESIRARQSALLRSAREEAGQWLAAGEVHTVAMRSDGSFLAVGRNNYGQLDVSNWTDVIAIAGGVGFHTVGLRADGTVTAAGNNDYSQCSVTSWKDIVSVSAGYIHTAGLRSDGTVVCTGNNSVGQCDTSLWRDIVAVAAGYAHTVGLRADGTVVAVGRNSAGELSTDTWEDMIAVAAGKYFTVGLKADGTVSVAGGYSYTITNDGTGETVKFRDHIREVSDWTDIVAIAAGGYHILGLKADGTVLAAGYDANGQCRVEDWTDIVAIASGYAHSLGLKADGTVLAVGDNNFGQCDVDGWDLFQ